MLQSLLFCDEIVELFAYNGRSDQDLVDRRET
jgi:hypothetical protein